jgi:hypothetical protein
VDEQRPLQAERDGGGHDELLSTEVPRSLLRRARDPFKGWLASPDHHAMSSSLLVLGGGPFSLPILCWAREAGLETHLVDADPRAAGRRVAHAFQTIPRDGSAALVPLARRLQAEAHQRGGRLAGILATEARDLEQLPHLAEAVPGVLPRRAALERVLASARVGEAARERLELFAFFRDGAFVPCGIAQRRTLETGDVLCLVPSVLTPSATRAAVLLAERAVRAAGLDAGLVEVELRPAGAELTVASIRPGVTDLVAVSHVARLAFGKSPLQAWFAHLAGAGGPFDEPITAPRSSAGWLSVAPPMEGIFAGADNVARTRALPGVADLWVDEPGRSLGKHGESSPLAYVWAAGDGAEAVEARLRAARATLGIRIAEVQRAA